MDTILQILNLLNATAPGTAQLILMIRKNDGTVALVGLLDQADAQFEANLKQAQDWLAKHPR